MKPRSFVVVLLVAAILTLPPIAQASPPDTTWIGGLWDDDDYDNVVVSVTTSVASMTRWPFDDSQRLQAVTAIVDPIEENDRHMASPSSSRTRASPASELSLSATTHGPPMAALCH